MVNAADSKSAACKGLRVRVSPRASCCAATNYGRTKGCPARSARPISGTSLARKVGSRRLHHQAKSNEATSIRASRPDKEVRTYQTGCDLRTAALLPTQPNDADLNAREQDPPGLDPEPPGRLGRLKEKPRGGSGKHAQRLREGKLVASHRTPRTAPQEPCAARPPRPSIGRAEGVWAGASGDHDRQQTPT